MPTCRSFGSEHVELSEFEKYMRKFLTLNVKAACATLGYSACVDDFPELVVALVLFYGGLLVHSSGSGHISGGELIGFVLYLNAMTESFSDMGEIYSDLVRALGASREVVELLNRESSMSAPSFVDRERIERFPQTREHRLLGVNATKVAVNRLSGSFPTNCLGQIVCSNVHVSYPTRPDRLILDGVNLTIPASAIVALVGTSGSGKSSIVKLIQHLYEPQSGSVCIDGPAVSELSPNLDKSLRFSCTTRTSIVCAQYPKEYHVRMGRNRYGTVARILKQQQNCPMRRSLSRHFPTDMTLR